MFKFDKYTVKFKHIWHDEMAQFGNDEFLTGHISHSSVKRAIKQGVMTPCKANTICTIFLEGVDVPVASGVSMLSWFDRFDQQKAVEKSFARAIAMLYPMDGGYSRNNAKKLRWNAWVEFAKHHKRSMGPLTEISKAVQS